MHTLTNTVQPTTRTHTLSHALTRTNKQKKSGAIAKRIARYRSCLFGTTMGRSSLSFTSSQFSFLYIDFKMTHTHAHTLSLSHAHTHTHTHILYLSLSCTHTHTHAPGLTFTCGNQQLGQQLKTAVTKREKI